METQAGEAVRRLPRLYSQISSSALSDGWANRILAAEEEFKMRIVLVLLMLLVVTSLKAVANDLADWTQVQKLKLGSDVRIVDRFGNAVDGYLVSVSRDELKLDVLVTNQPGLLSPPVFARSDIREAYKLGKRFERRLSGKNLVLASTIGLLGGIAIGAAVDQAHPSVEDPGQGKLVGGVLGFFMGPAALASGRAVVSGLHQTKLIYRAALDRIMEPSQPRVVMPHSFRHLDSSIQMLPVDSPYS